MKRSRFSSWLFAAAALCAFAFSTFAAPAVALVVATGRTLKNLVLDGLQLAVPADQSKSAVVVAFVQARAFVLRLIKRDRPVKSTEWSMCPST